MRKQLPWYRTFYRRHVLINSFWGLEKPICHPPNFVMTGPLSKPADALMESLQQKDPTLMEWLNDAQEKG